MLVEKLQGGIANKIKQQVMKEIVKLLEYKKQIILQGSPGTGKIRLAKEIASEITKSKTLVSVQQKLEDFLKNIDPYKVDVVIRKHESECLLKAFQKKFPKEKLIDLTLEDYAMGTGTNDSFCWWIERGLQPLGYYFPGSARSYLIYWSKKKGGYSTHFKHAHTFLNADDISGSMNKLARRVSDLVIKKDISSVADILGISYTLKILHSYYPDEFFPMNSLICLRNALKLFGVDSIGKTGLEMNLELQQIFIRMSNEYNKNLTNDQFMLFLFENFDLKG